MLSKINNMVTLLAIFIVLSLIISPSYSQVLIDDIIVDHDFEYEDPFISWVNNGNHNINYKGISAERSSKGSKSFKLEMQFSGAKYVYFRIPVNIPVSERLHFDADIFLSKSESVGVALGSEFQLEPSLAEAYLLDKRISKTDEWDHIHYDLTEEASRLAKKSIVSLGGANVNDVVPKINQIGIFLFSETGFGHVTLYIDNLKITGHRISNEDQVSRAKNAWDNYEKRIKNQLAHFRIILEENKLQHMIRESAESIEVASKVLDNIDSSISSKKYVDTKIYNTMIAQTLTKKALEDGSVCDNRLTLHPRKTISNAWPEPNQFPLQEAADKNIQLIGAPDEYVSGSITLHSFEDLSNIEISPKSNKLPNSIIDLRLVKYWFQSGKGTISRQKDRYLLPELLVHDDKIVNVDIENQKNLLRIKTPVREEYIDISSDNDPGISKSSTIQDSYRLKPFNMNKDSNKHLWITVYIPQGQKSGIYKIPLEIKVDSKACGEITLSIEVLPFNLSNSKIDQAIYYRGFFTPKAIKITSEEKSTQQYLIELKNMADHGINTVSVYDQGSTYLAALKIRKEMGFNTENALLLGNGTGTPNTKNERDALTSRVKQIVTDTRKLGYTNVYLYGKEESHGSEIYKQKQTWEATHAGGGKVFTAVYKDAVQYIGDTLDLPIIANELDADVAQKWHLLGKPVYSYSNPQVGIEEPETYRRNYGYALWCANYDGAMHYAYQHQFGKNIWNDFDDKVYRDHVFAYPTSDGVVDTIQWEGLREGINDLRYLSTLLANKNQDENSLRSLLCKGNIEPEAIRTWIIKEITQNKHGIEPAQ